MFHRMLHATNPNSTGFLTHTIAQSDLKVFFFLKWSRASFFPQLPKSLNRMSDLPPTTETTLHIPCLPYVLSSTHIKERHPTFDSLKVGSSQFTSDWRVPMVSWHTTVEARIRFTNMQFNVVQNGTFNNKNHRQPVSGQGCICYGMMLTQISQIWLLWSSLIDSIYTCEEFQL